MAHKSVVGNEGVAQTHEEETVIDEDGFEVIDEAAVRMNALRPSVEHEIHGRIDTDTAAARGRGLTLVEEERIAAEEAEIRRTVERRDRRQGSDREARTRHVAETTARNARETFAERAASVDPRFEPGDPRARLDSEALAAVNREATRLQEGLSNGTSRAAIARQLADRVVDGTSLLSASLAVVEAEKTRPERVVDIEQLADVDASQVNIQGEVTRLFEPNSRKIDQVGLIEDETGTTKFTAWRRSGADRVRVGDEVRLLNVAKNWYNGRVSVAVTGWSEVWLL